MGLASGPQPARVLVVGEAPGADEERIGSPFVGASGWELDKMLAEVGIQRSSCRVTNVTSVRPPNNDISEFFLTKAAAKSAGLDELYEKFPNQHIRDGLVALRTEITSTQPNIIIALGSTALWALTGEFGISDWRGSMLTVNGPVGSFPIKVVPTFHPAAILRQWSWRNIMLHDLRRVAANMGPESWVFPVWTFNIRPTLSDLEVFVRLNKGRRLAIDIETTSRWTSLVGIAASKSSAICIPFMTKESRDGNYWPADEEPKVVALLRELLEGSPCVGQNLMYDVQYLLRQFNIYPWVVGDTLFQQHVCFPGLPKDLAFLSSMYCKTHKYWKDDLKDYRALPLDESKFRNYNLEDCVRTFEIFETLEAVVTKMRLTTQFTFMMSLFRPVLSMMVHGTPVSKARQKALVMQLDYSAKQFETFFEAVVGERVGTLTGSKWYSSPKQLATLLFTEMSLPMVRNRKTGQPTTNDEALEKIGKSNSLLRHLMESIRDYRSLEVYANTFAAAGVDPDGSIRCSFNIAGTETFRFSSSENAFGGGTNLQNIPRFDPKTNPLLPNVRAIFVPGTGEVLLDWDLDRADAQVVAWEADDLELKTMLRAGVDLHKENAKVIYGLKDVASVTSAQRQVAKMFVHGSNYGGSARTMAINCGITVHMAEMGQTRWFGAHPQIKQWHARVRNDLLSTRRVRNAFGFHRIYFDRPEGLLSQALAWLPQSTVALVINHGLLNIWNNLPWVRLRLQVHDSLVMTIPEAYFRPADLQRIRQQLLISVPYSDPLVIPVGCKASRDSWGTVEPVDLGP